MMLTYRPEA